MLISSLYVAFCILKVVADQIQALSLFQGHFVSFLYNSLNIIDFFVYQHQRLSFFFHQSTLYLEIKSFVLFLLIIILLLCLSIVCVIPGPMQLLCYSLSFILKLFPDYHNLLSSLRIDIALLIFSKHSLDGCDILIFFIEQQNCLSYSIVPDQFANSFTSSFEFSQRTENLFNGHLSCQFDGHYDEMLFIYKDKFKEIKENLFKKSILSFKLKITTINIFHLSVDLFTFQIRLYSAMSNCLFRHFHSKNRNNILFLSQLMLPFSQKSFIYYKITIPLRLAFNCRVIKLEMILQRLYLSLSCNMNFLIFFFMSKRLNPTVPLLSLSWLCFFPSQLNILN